MFKSPPNHAFFTTADAVLDENSFDGKDDFVVLDHKNGTNEKEGIDLIQCCSTQYHFWYHQVIGLNTPKSIFEIYSSVRPFLHFSGQLSDL